MKIYNYDPISGILLGESMADENPVRPGDYLIPAFATTDVPPEPQADKTPVYKNGAWARVSDFRGTDAWRTDTGEKVTVTELGTLNSQGLTDQAYPDYPATWNGAEWVVDEAAKAAMIQKSLVFAVQSHLDAAAQARNYDDIKTACTYADEPAVPKFQAEGQAFRAWRSLVWAACYSILADVLTGTRTVPTVDELLAELPALSL